MFAIVLPLLVLRLPVTGIVLVAVVAQEIKPNGRFGELTTLGYQAFISPGKTPMVLPLAVTAALAAAARWWPPKGFRLRSTGGLLLGVAVALVVVSVGSGLLHGQSVFSAVNQNARPFVLLVLGLLIGMSLRWLRDDQRSLRMTVGAVLAALLVAAAVAIPLGETADDRLSAYFVYYDSALPAIAAAVFIGLLGHDGWRWDWRHVTVLATTPLLVLISFRRSVWLAAFAAFVVVLVLTWRRWRRMTRQLAVAALVVAVIVLAAPGFAADLGLRSVGSFDLGNGDTTASKPSPSNKPSPSSVPSASNKPSASSLPSATGNPSAGGGPGATGKPSAGGGPGATGKPSATAKPSATPKPSVSSGSSAGGGTAPSGRPSATGAPSARPSATGGPSAGGVAARPSTAATSRPPSPTPAPESAKHQAESTSGHISDLRLGWDYVRANFWTGVGPQSPQLAGMAAADATRVYVHNELLQDWLRYGPAVPLLVVVFLVAAGLVALRAVRDPASDGIVRSAAVFCLIAPLCLMTAPFLSETSRWPLVVGLAAGIVAPLVLDRDRHGRRTEPTPSASSPSPAPAEVEGRAAE
ncbi:O-antigen ligase family protein [Micromonospora sp. WMMD812]|uniref:O-antigen ligase family protein n=1 Tax=Micromonospora sp. WMMD812 TaxID=3015152 RepID=UPI00248B40F1|nr:O-antigen ligase family protein [Micromonospora sp. WMMD812]WBB70635.1 O-antigen ligase family protein [Micromonospora sp. WMMD812]